MKAALVAALCCSLISGPLISGDRTPVPDGQVSLHQTVRDLDMRIEVKPKSWVVRLIITNQSQEKRFLLRPSDLTHFRISLTDGSGRLLKMTTSGVQDLTESANGSVRKIELENGRPAIDSVDLGKLFEVSVSGEIRCEISRLIYFTEPLKQKPAEKEWIKFPAVRILAGVTGPLSIPPAKAAAEDRQPNRGTNRGTD